MQPKITLSALAMVILAMVIIANPFSSLSVLAFLALAFIVVYKIFGEYAILILLLVRPTIDVWRDVVLFSYQNFSININAALAILLLVWSVWFLGKNLQYLKEVPYKKWWLAFLLWCVITLFWSFDKSSTIIETIKAMDLYALFATTFVLAKKYPKKYPELLHWTLFGSAVVPIIIGIYQFISKTGMTIDDVPNRIYGTFVHPNIMATFALLIFMAIVNRFLHLQRGRPIFKLPKSTMNTIFVQKKYYLIFASIILIVVIGITYTRIAWIGLALFLIILGILYRPRLLAEISVIAILGYITFFPINNFLIDSFNINLQSNSLISRLTTRNKGADSIQWRLDVANKILPLYWEHPIIGYGYGSFAKVWDENKPIQNIWDNTSEAHNDYLKVLFETGVIGAVLFLLIFAIMLIRQIRYALKNGWINIVFISSVLVYLALSLSDNMLHHTPVIWWLWTMWGYWSAENM